MVGFVLNIYIVMPILLYLTFLSCSLFFVIFYVILALQLCILYLHIG